MQGMSMGQGNKESLGFLATISPTPPASFTIDVALIAASWEATKVKQRITFPIALVPLSVRASQTLRVFDLYEDQNHSFKLNTRFSKYEKHKRIERLVQLPWWSRVKSFGFWVYQACETNLLCDKKSLTLQQLSVSYQSRKFYSLTV